MKILIAALALLAASTLEAQEGAAALVAWQLCILQTPEVDCTEKYEEPIRQGLTGPRWELLPEEPSEGVAYCYRIGDPIYQREVRMFNSTCPVGWATAG